jgi:FAD/FMN-containing dehydrogenase
LWRRGDPGYEDARLAAVWNSRKPDRHPAAIVRAATDQDVAWAVRTAAAEGLTVSVRSGGHSWYGNAVRDGVMLIDLSRLTAIEIDRGSMCAAVEPAAIGRDLDAALLPEGLFFPIGHCGTVGLGGFALGGGYGWNSRVLGPACLSIRALDLVTADGEILHADDSSHPELIWAARGCGPGFFAAVTRFHFELAQRPTIARAMHVYPLSLHDEVLAWMLELLPELPAELEVSGRVGFSHLVDQPAVALSAMAFAPDGDTASLLAHLERCPLRDRALLRQSFAVEGLPDLHDRGGAGTPVLRWDVDGIWTNTPAAEIIPAAVAAGLASGPGGDSFVLWMFWGHHPERANACWSIQAPLYVSPNAGWADPADDERQMRWVDEALRALQPHSCGVQFSDANLSARAGEGISAANLARVEQIRARYDPEGRFCTYMTSG